MSEEKLKEGITKTANENALNTVNKFLKGEIDYDEKVSVSIKMLGMAGKIMQMSTTERGQNVRLLKYMSNPKMREQYIALTNPEVKSLG